MKKKRETGKNGDRVKGRKGTKGRILERKNE
jgi:hypothetical protein